MNRSQQEPSALEKAMNYLSRRGHSEAELAAKLHRAGFGKFEISHALQECRRLGLINDELFARDCAEMLSCRGCGNYRIRRDLAKRGVAEFAASAIEELPESEARRELEAARFKLRLLIRETDPRKKREKLYRFLAGRGFSPASVRQALDRLRAEEDHPELADEEPDL